MKCEVCGNTNIQIYERGDGTIMYRCPSCEREWS